MQNPRSWKVYPDFAWVCRTKQFFYTPLIAVA